MRRKLGTAPAMQLYAASLVSNAKDTLVVANLVEPPHHDPTPHVAGSIREVVYANVYEGLTLIERAFMAAPIVSTRRRRSGRRPAGRRACDVQRHVVAPVPEPAW